MRNWLEFGRSAGPRERQLAVDRSTEDSVQSRNRWLHSSYIREHAADYYDSALCVSNYCKYYSNEYSVR